MLSHIEGVAPKAKHEMLECLTGHLRIALRQPSSAPSLMNVLDSQSSGEHRLFSREIEFLTSPSNIPVHLEQDKGSGFSVEDCIEALYLTDRRTVMPYQYVFGRFLEESSHPLRSESEHPLGSHEMCFTVKNPSQSSQTITLLPSSDLPEGTQVTVVSANTGRVLFEPDGFTFSTSPQYYELRFTLPASANPGDYKGIWLTVTTTRIEISPSESKGGEDLVSTSRFSTFNATMRIVERLHKETDASSRILRYRAHDKSTLDLHKQYKVEAVLDKFNELVGGRCVPR